MPTTKAKTTTKKVVAKKTEKKTVTGEASVVKTVSVLAASTLLRPVVTEKAAGLADKGVYAFHVPKSANRIAVRQAFREVYGVTPVKVNVIISHGKEGRFGGVLSRASDSKKALVTVPAGTRVDIFKA